MKIVVSSTGPELSSAADPRFGRCGYFIVVDTDSMEVTAHSNESRAAAGGAGIQAGQFVSSLGVSAVVTGAVGPNAARVLSTAGLKVYVGAEGTVQQAVDAFKAGKLTAAASATVGAHSGMR